MLGKFGAVALGVLAVGVLAACGGGGDAIDVQPTTEASPSPTALATAAPDATLAGAPIVPLEVGPEIEIPEDVALIVEIGCTECDGPTEGLSRFYRDASGEVRIDELFRSPQGSYISSYVVRPGGSQMVVTVCLEWECGPLGPVQPGARTALLQSSDGGVTWRELAVLDGAFYVSSMTDDGIILMGPTDAEGYLLPQFQLFPDGPPLEPVGESQFSQPIVLLRDQIVWRTKDGRLLRSDTSELIALGEDIQVGWISNGFIEPHPSGERLVLPLMQETADETHFYLGEFDIEGRLLRAFAGNVFSSLRTWLGSGMGVGNASVPREDLMMPPERSGFDSFTLPVIFDLDAGMIHPIPHPFLERYGRNRVVAVLHGPFLRVDTPGDCLNVRDEPRLSGGVIDCAADGVLLRDADESREMEGQRWLAVITPSGEQGWAAQEFLTR